MPSSYSLRAVISAIALALAGNLAACEQQSVVAPSTLPESSKAVAAQNPFQTYDRQMRSDEITLRLPGGGSLNAEREYMVQMNAGDTLVYSWSTQGADSNEFYYELHGQDPADIGKVIASFEKKMDTKGNGAFTVTTPGQYGWFFQNQSTKPVTVKLHISGFYDPIAASK